MDSNTFNQLTPAQKMMVAQFAKTLTQTPTPSTSTTSTSPRKRTPTPSTSTTPTSPRKRQHSNTNCPSCGITLQRRSLAKHQQRTCPNRQIKTSKRPSQLPTTANLHQLNHERHHPNVVYCTS